MLASPNTRSSGAICPQRPTPPPRSTVCAFLRPTRSSLSHGSGTSSASSERLRRRTARSSPSTQIHEKRPQKVKNFGIWIRYDSRSGTHNMYKEYREMSRVAAVDALYQDMAARHRSRFRQVQILKVVEIEKSDDVRRPYIKQLLVKGLKFPLPHRINKKAGKKVFAAKRPSTFF
ncbi:hypothetical protein SNOG_11611 [Parastagonospora nodorum SN15]|uniref:60S ribosomal protein L20 n=1 Tax=Phaeosphaeria nodorum (strain SN15 / ATCC MYA-4574 / FGSC 10173) TaxID=321614 RepID=Q0U9F3_PHANO|nr:hypothetical protein SNOG_11611 [Parastagonospora nodorum SN15]EAT81319.2 hypothetical protein SNOG_11611 [Parastagonospora nodorum SN15]